MNQVADSAWLIPVPTLAVFAAITLGLRRSPGASGWLTVSAVLAAFLLSLKVFAEALSGVRVVHSYNWLPVDALSVPSNLGSVLSLGFQVDPLTATMLIVVSSVSLKEIPLRGREPRKPALA